jgi:hypothetical protein
MKWGGGGKREKKREKEGEKEGEKRGKWVVWIMIF